MSSDPQYSYTKLNDVVYTCNPSSGVETSGSLKLTDQPVSRINEFQVQWDQGSKKLKVESN